MEKLQNIAYEVSRRGLSCSAELSGSRPQLELWIIVECRRQTLSTMHNVLVRQSSLFTWQIAHFLGQKMERHACTFMGPSLDSCAEKKMVRFISQIFIHSECRWPSAQRGASARTSRHLRAECPTAARRDNQLADSIRQSFNHAIYRYSVHSQQLTIYSGIWALGSILSAKWDPNKSHLNKKLHKHCRRLEIGFHTELSRTKRLRKLLQKLLSNITEWDSTYRNIIDGLSIFREESRGWVNHQVEFSPELSYFW